LVDRALSAYAVPRADRAAVADALTVTSLRGVATHGLRLLPQYLADLEARIANPRPVMRVVRETPAAALLDADNALGMVAGLRGARLAADKAATTGIGAVVVRESNHFGAASVYTRSMAAEGFIGWSMTSASARVSPYNGREPLLGTNPISVAAGSGHHEFVLDMATSQVCLGEVKERGRRDLPLDPGWAKDSAGRPAVRAQDVVALSPLGAGHKGQGLGMLVSLMTAALADAPLDWELEHIEDAAPGRGRRVAHFLLCLDPAVFAGRERFGDRLRDLVDGARQAPPAASVAVLSPGDPERERERANRRAGVPLDATTAGRLRELAERYGLEGPTSTKPEA
jgi:LDH2 family malate/lactate/ureidoglycolate dehydrogenase